MKIIFIIVSIVLIAPSCKNKENNDILEYDDGQYVRLISKEKTVWILEFSCLYNVTPADVEDLSIGLKERKDILTGRKVLSDSIIENLECESIKLPKSLKPYKEFLDSVKNNDSIRINSLPYPEIGLYINELINKGYVVTFADDEGEFYVRSK